MAAPQEPLIIRDKQEMRKWSRSMKMKGKTIGLVPTMGFLHKGHISLINKAHKHAQLIVVSIYVNPGQFSTSEDISTYPSDFNGDLNKLMCVNGGVDVVFNPYNLYDYGGKREKKEGNMVVSCVEESGGGHETWVRVENLEKGLCGKSRPLFFRGVATVVSKLFNIVEPHVAVFGKKDYQQWRIISRMDGRFSLLLFCFQPHVVVFGTPESRPLTPLRGSIRFSFNICNGGEAVRDLDFPVKVIGSEIMREDDGLAMSSRNVYLTKEERQKALSISRSLSKAKHAVEEGITNCKQLRESLIQTLEEAGGKVDYAEIVDQHTLEVVEEVKSPVVFCIAAWFGKARLLDNIEIIV